MSYLQKKLEGECLAGFVLRKCGLNTRIVIPLFNMGAWSLPLIGDAMKPVGMKISATGKHLMVWHKDVFEHLKVEMRLVQEKMNDIMKQTYSVDQYEEQKSLHIRYSELMSHHETYWRQRSRVLWLRDGDRNSAFFHRRASNRRSQNKIKGLTDSEGVWHTQPAKIRSLLLDYFENIFKAEGIATEAIDEVVEAVGTRVTPGMNDTLLLPITDNEIKDLFQMHPSKSPGPDGMSPFFFQKYWSIVGVDVCLAVRNFLETGVLWQESNFTYLTLITKVKDPKDVTQLRPIALCNVVYKISSKVVANRLKVILPSIISPS